MSSLNIIHRNFKLGKNIKSTPVEGEFNSSRTYWQSVNNNFLSSPKLASVSCDKSIKFYELNKGKSVHTINNGHLRSIRCLLYLQKTAELVTGGDRLDNSIKIWSLSHSNFAKCNQKLNGHTSGVNCLLLIQETYCLVSGSQDSQIIIWDLKTGQILATLLGHTGWIQNLLYLPETDTLLSTDLYGTDYDQIMIWDLNNGKCLKSYINQRDRSESCITLLSDSIIASGIGKSVFLWSLNEEKVLNTLEGHEWTVLCLLVLPGGMLFTGSADKTIKLWKPSKSNKSFKTFKGHKGSVCSLISLYNKDEILSAAYDGMIKIWSVKSGLCLKTIISGHSSQINSLISISL